jgi:hypothetical protein
VTARAARIHAGGLRSASQRMAVRRPAAKRCAGQALVEVLAATLLLIPIWLAVYYISRWHDLQFTTQNAARYAAVESWMSGGLDAAPRVAAVTRERLFSRALARFRSEGAPEAAASLGDVPQWLDHGAGAPLLSAQPGPEVQIDPVGQAAEVTRLETLGFDLIAPAIAVGRGPFDLPRDAARSVVVRAPVRAGIDLPGLAADQPFVLQERSVLMVSTWAARDAAQVVRRIDSISPAGQLRELMEPLRGFRWAVRALEPAFDALCLGRTSPDIVPPDRLVGGNRAGYDMRTEDCP